MQLILVVLHAHLFPPTAMYCCRFTNNVIDTVLAEERTLHTDLARNQSSVEISCASRRSQAIQVERSNKVLAVCGYEMCLLASGPGRCSCFILTTTTTTTTTFTRIDFGTIDHGRSRSRETLHPASTYI